MASKRHLRRQAEARLYRQCARKKPVTAAFARSVIADMEARGEMGMRAYKCPHCGKLHLGHGGLSRGDFL